MVIRENWVEAKFEDLLKYIQPTNYIVKSTKYSDTFNTPVLTPGKSFIKGYTNEEDGIFEDIPAIIFDDFTTASRYVNFPFKVKSSAMKILKPTSELVNLKYIFNVMQITNVRSDTHKRYWISIFAKKKIPLPPLSEQCAIIAKIEQLFSELDKGIASFKSAQKKLDIYRQAVLKKAFEGELTKTWRKQQNNLPTADELLQQIKQQRQQHYQQQINDWEKAVKKWEIGGKEGRKPAKPRKLKNLGLVKIKDLHNLSNSFFWVHLSELFSDSPQNGIYKPASVYGSGIDIIRISDFYDGKLVKFMNFEKVQLSSDEVSKYHLKDGQILINRVNSIEYLGKCGLVEKLKRDTVFESNIMKLSLLSKNTSSKYITYYLSSGLGLKELRKNAKHAVNQASINQTDVSYTRMPLCSKEEQTQIVQEIESRLSVCDQLSKTLKQQLKKAEALRQSILKKAFEGRLLTQVEIQTCQQQPDWEPAEQLLARIKAESTKKTTTKPRKKIRRADKR